MMKDTIVTPSSQIDSTLPHYIYENYSEFVNFMTKAAESDERIGFGQDILQNLQKYRNFDAYKNQIVQFETLNATISAEDEELTLASGFGFPEDNGVILIGDEVILYQTKEGNTFYGLERGAPGTKVLPTFRSSGEYVKTVAAEHAAGSQVTNLSVLFLVAMLDTIHKSFTPNIESVRISPEVNRSSLLQNIKDFFGSKGSKLGIQALFKMLFAENDVDVSYPGDQMVVPSDSTWYKSVILRTVPLPKTFCDPTEGYGSPAAIIGAEITYKSLTDDKVYARVMCDYVSAYPYESEVQYELSIDSANMSGNLFANPKTELTRTLNIVGGTDDRKDVYTVTVASTIGFPESGVIYIEDEAVAYTSKTLNQFLGCTRGYVGVEATHTSGAHVYGPYYLEASYEKDGETYVSRSWPLGLVGSIAVNDPGTLHSVNDEVFVSGAGREDKRDLAFSSFIENTADQLAGQDATEPNLAYISNYTAGPSGVYMTKNAVAVATSSLPYYDIGPFSTDNSLGPNLTGHNDRFVIPRRHAMRENTIHKVKGTGIIGVFVDGCPAYSNESTRKLYHGAITNFVFTNNGANYKNPTVLINGTTNSSFSPVVTNGRVSGINGAGSGFFTSIPAITITSGQGAVFALTFDRYGRITGATVTSGGLYYKDTPTLQVVDASGRGKGAVLACTVSGGSVTAVTIIGSGIDYNPATTTVEANAVGSGANVTAEVESYTYDAVREILDSETQMLDDGNGFIFDNGTRFGYPAGPFELLNQLGDNISAHSAIVGWALDGNPIYGPYGYANGVDATDGIQRGYSAYTLRTTREGISPNGSDIIATSPPSTTTYPLGTFVEDYEYTGADTSVSIGRLDTENDDNIQTEGGVYINGQVIPGFLVDANNGRVCNTPDFPADLYPDGVYCYFTTLIGQTPYFPYIIGQTFQNMPLNQAEVLAGFNLFETAVHRHRTSGLPTTGDEVVVNVDTISAGSVSEVVIEDGSPATTVVGDILRYDSTGTKGAGAEGKVTHVTGVEVADAFGQELVTRMLSHRQRVNLRFNDGEDYTFSKGASIRTTTGAEGVVDSYDTTNMFLDVTVTTENLIKFGDTFSDMKGRVITIPTSLDGNDQIMFDNIAGSASTFISYNQPDDGTARAGDLWWSADLGRLFIYFTDQDGTSQWVATNPTGSRPLEGSTDLTTGQPGPVSQSFSVPQAENVVTIATMAPSGRSDGSANQAGDLWWSNHSGLLYIWNSDKIADYEQGELEWTGEWICTDPSALNVGEGASDTSAFDGITPTEETYETTVTVMVSEGSPTAMQDGGVLVHGALWWSPLSGRMYIYYNDVDTSQWVATNPGGVLASKYGSNNIIIGDGGTYPDYITILPSRTNTTDLWFESLKYFEVGDTIEFRVGAPGIEELVEQALIQERTADNRLTVLRGTNGNVLELPHGVKTFNMSRGIYTVDTASPHGLRNGDEVIISGSNFQQVNGKHTLENAGVVIPATGTVTIIDGEITAVNITTPGNFYSRNFYITFSGGGGVGALAFATIADLVDGGGVASVAMLEGGYNYTSQPNIIFGDETPNTRFTFFTASANGEDAGVSYITDTNAIRNTAARIAITSPGVGYESMPTAIGLLKKQSDRAQTKITMVGQTVGSVEVLSGGFRYVNPIAVFTDSTGAGTGAAATVNHLDGIIQSVNVIRGGSAYVEPYLEILEADGKFISKTETIGQIKSLKVLNPGRNIANDKTLTPELDVETKVVLSNPVGSFSSGQLVYQGSNNLQFASGTVSGYNSATQILTIRRISGNIIAGETIQNIFGGSGLVIQSGQADIDVVVNGSSEPTGRFIDNSSMPSETFAVIQDSYYYQRFSYSISSPMQQVQFEDFVQDIVHPAGFKMFSDVRITQAVSSPSGAVDVTFSSDEDYSAYELLISQESTDTDLIYVWTQNNEFIDL